MWVGGGGTKIIYMPLLNDVYEINYEYRYMIE